MRTTISLDDAFYSVIRRAAAAEGVSISRLIERLVREGLADSATAPSEEPPYVPVTFGGSGVAPGVRWDRLTEIDDDLP